MTVALPDELESLADAMRREPSTEETASWIYTNLGRFRTDWKNGQQLCGNGLVLPTPRNQGLHPVGCELHFASLDFQYEWRDGEVMPWRAEYQVRVEGLLDAGGALFELQDHWRIDTDMYAPSRRGAENAAQNPSKEPHPLFHFQRGGHAQDAFASRNFLPGTPCAIQGEWRGLLQSPGPRVPVLPLDPILAIDFCLSQNDGTVWRRLQNFPEYLTIIQEAQRRLWEPFFEALQDPVFRRTWFGPSLLV
ncbi:hypothetical protein [Rhodobacter maris]|uniref:Uncharacterized protein n=1 Tax=Rhodobacter maris TaxID=446682 RepID=A0A285TIL4_9RHOB|nr:hypothetical protein [Rhodobacter maris]SOC22106.1 hypothetical protein SAMN05877831_1276 [Rhodobacter maris]